MLIIGKQKLCLKKLPCWCHFQNSFRISFSFKVVQGDSPDGDLNHRLPPQGLVWTLLLQPLLITWENKLGGKRILLQGADAAGGEKEEDGEGCCAEVAAGGVGGMGVAKVLALAG